MTNVRPALRGFAACVLALGGLAIAGGCSGDQKNGAASPTAEGAGAEASADKSAAAQPAVQTASSEKTKVIEGAPPGSDDRYALSIDTPEVKAGEKAQVVVRVVPKEPWHMNLDFPTSLKIDPPSGVAVDKPEMKKADAAALDDNQAQFDVEFTAAEAGEKAFSGTFKFAVCQDDACAPVTENVQFKVAVR